MKLQKLIDTLKLEVKAGKDRLNNEVTGGYASDLLSDVMANSQVGDIWITLHVHENIAAVAALNDLAGILIINNRCPDESTIERANQEGVPILVSALSAFELIGRLYDLGIRGV